MKVLSGEGIKDFALLGIFQIVRGQRDSKNAVFMRLPGISKSDLITK